MIIRVNGQILDGRYEVEVEKQAKLFEEIDESYGDFSYQLELDYTSRNLGIIGNPLPNNSDKIIYNSLACDILDDDGLDLYTGMLRIERISHSSYFIQASFFSGNYNWISLLTGDMTELRLYQYDTDQTSANVMNSWNDTEGLIFPFVDTGCLVTRSYINVKTEDFVGAFYVKTLFREIFTQSGIKLAGDLFKDATFDKLLVMSNTRSKFDKEDNSVFIASFAEQGIPFSTATDIIFDSYSALPYTIGDSISFNGTTEITINHDMICDISFYWKMDTNNSVSGRVDINNSTPTRIGSSGSEQTAEVRNFKLYAGDVLKCQIQHGFPGDTYTVLKAEFKIVPKFVYYASGRSAVPLWSKQEFVSRILNVFNCVTDFDSKTKTLTIDLFEKIKTKAPIDISRHIKVEDVDYVDFISNYGKNNYFQYQESDEEDLSEYNVSSYLKYGAGKIECDNDFIQDEILVIDSQFASPISYQHPVFTCSLEKINFTELEEGESQDFATVTDSSGTPRFNITDADDYFAENDLVRIESSEVDYRGDFLVASVTSTYIAVRGLDYTQTASGTITLLSHKVTTDDSVYLFVNSGELNTTDFSNRTSFFFDSTADATWNFSYFNIIPLGFDVEGRYPQSLSFGGQENVYNLQTSLIQKYWRTFGSILNDPVKLYCTAHFPKTVFQSLTPLRPVYIRTEQATGLYYINRITGYKGSHLPCEVELIKL